jgi:hypothetical protein
MILERWNPKTREYEPYEVPDDRRIWCTGTIMDRMIDCASCGRELPVEKAFTSIEIHTPIGFGYSVCEECYEGERRRYHGEG